MVFNYQASVNATVAEISNWTISWLGVQQDSGWTGVYAKQPLYYLLPNF
jgi:hypothetical protein